MHGIIKKKEASMKIENILNKKNSESSYIETKMNEAVRGKGVDKAFGSIALYEARYLVKEDSEYMTSFTGFEDKKTGIHVIENEIKTWNRPSSGWNYKDPVILNAGDKIVVDGSKSTFIGAYQDKDNMSSYKNVVLRSESTGEFFEINVRNNQEAMIQLKSAIEQKEVVNSKISNKNR
jgi:hypothetical protein